MPLTPKQQRFVEEYPIDLDATQAYIRAGYSGKGASQSASALLANPKVAAALAVESAERSRRVEATADHVLMELASMGFIAPQDMAAWGGEDVTLRPADKLKALELLARHFGMLQPGASDPPPDEQEMYWKQRDPVSDLRVIDQPPSVNGNRSNGAT